MSAARSQPAPRARRFAPIAPVALRSSVIFVRVTPAEHADLCAIAARAGLTLTSYVRWALLQRHGGPLRPCDLRHCPLNPGGPDADPEDA